MNPIRSTFAAIWCGVYSWRHVIGVILIVTLAANLIFPTPAYAQFGLLSGIENILNIINGVIRSALNLIGAVTESLQGLHQQIVWPLRLINEARNAIASLIAQFRGTMHSIDTVAVASATLPTPVALEAIVRSEEHTSELQSHSFISYAVFC